MSVRSKLLFPLIFLGISFSAILHLYWLPIFYDSQIRDIKNRETVSLEVLATGIISPLLAGDLAQVHTTMDQLLSKQNSWKALYLKTPDNLLLYPVTPPRFSAHNDTQHEIAFPIMFGERHVANLTLIIDVNDLFTNLQKQIFYLEKLLLGVLFLISIITAYMQDHWIRRPIKSLAKATSLVAEGDFQLALPDNSNNDEVGALISSFESMRQNLVQWEKSLSRQNTQLNAISAAQSRFIRDVDLRELFDGLLMDILNLTDSEYGFIGEVLYRDNVPYLNTFAITNIAWNEETRKYYDEKMTSGMEFTNMKTLFGATITSAKVVIANEPKTDSRGAGIPSGHPSLDAFLGIPFLRNGKVIGMFGIANKACGYDDQLVKFLHPITTTCAHIVEAIKADRQRAKAEAKIHEDETRMRTIIENVVDGIITTNESGIIESFNQAAQNIFGYSPSEVIGKNIRMLTPVRHQDRHNEYISQYLRGKESKIIGTGREVEGLRKDGSSFSLEIAVNEMWIDGQRFFCSIMRDIMERKKVDRMKSEFVSTVSHELRTPLTSIRGALGLVTGELGKQLSDQIRSMLELAERNSERLTLLINDILDLEKIESGRLEFEFKHTDLVTLAQRSLEDNEGYAHKHNVHLVLDKELEQAEVCGDEQRLLQVFANLISNAVKFSPQEGNVTISIVPRYTGFRVSVLDNGEGIPDEFRSRIFQRFAQADGSDTKKKGGTGLGLSISKAIIEHHDGQIGYNTNQGTGTEFYFDLPQCQEAHNTGNTHLTQKALRQGTS